MRRGPAGLTGVVVIGLALGLSGCSAGGAQEEPTPSTGTARATAQAEAEADADVDAEPDAEGPPEAEVGPVTAFLDAVRGLGEESELETARRIEALETAIAECMGEQGFEYVPVPYVPRPDDDGREPPADVDPVESAREFGYGIAYSGAGRATAEGAVPFPENPNAEIVAAMSDAEEDAYWLALWGPGQGEEYAMGLEPYDWTQHGCGAVAQQEVPGAVLEQFDATAFEPLRQEIDAMWIAVPDDPAMQPVVEEWVRCMSDAGYPGFSHVMEPLEQTMQLSEAIWADTYGTLDFSGDDLSESPGYAEATAESERRHAELLADEIELAVADTTCQVEVDYVGAYTQAMLAAERDFYATHEAELEAWRAAYDEFAAGLG